MSALGVMRATKLSPVGVDIGASAVRVAQLMRSGDRWRHFAAGRNSLRREAAAQRDELARQLKSAFMQAEFRGAAAVASVGAPHVQLHALELPAAVVDDPQAAPQAVSLEVERLMTFPEGTAEVRHWRLPAARGAAPTAVGLAASRDAVLSVVETCRAADLRCHCVDAAPAALARCAAAVRPPGQEEVWGVLDLGERETRLVVCVDQAPVLARAIADGGAAWTNLIATGIQVTAEAAEFHKRNHGIALAGRALRQEDAGFQGPDSEVPGILLNVLRSELNRIGMEVKRSYEYVLSCYPQRRAGDMILVGGGALLRNLPEFLQASLGIGVHRISDYLGQPAARLDWAVSTAAPLEQYAAAAGLCMAEGELA